MRAVAYISGVTGKASSTVDVEAPAPEPEEARIARLAWEAARIEEALTSIRDEGTISHEKVQAWVDSWDTPGELPQPQPRLS